MPLPGRASKRRLVGNMHIGHDDKASQNRKTRFGCIEN
jgi:hypothetical protein